MEHTETDRVAPDAPRRSGAATPLALAGIGGLAIGLIAWGWMQFGDAIYLNQLATFVASCF